MQLVRSKWLQRREATSLKSIYIVAKDKSIRFHRILNWQFDIFVICWLYSWQYGFPAQCYSKDSDKIMSHNTLRHVPEAFYRIHTLKGVCGYSLIWGQEVKPSGRKMNSEHFTELKWALKTHKYTLFAACFFQKPN